MGEKVYVAKQDTLLEVQQTGTEVQQTVNKTDATIGDIGDPAGEDSVVALSKDIKKSVDSLAGQKPEILLPSDNLKIDFLDKQIDLPKGQNMFLGYLYFNKPGIVKFVSRLKAKTSESSGSSIFLMPFGGSQNMVPVVPSDEYIQVGTVTSSSNFPVPFSKIPDHVGRVIGTSYVTSTRYARVEPGLYGFGINGYYAGVVCDSIKIYYDVVGVDQYVTKMR